MVAWLDRAERMSSAHRHPDRAASRPEAAPHERYLWDSGFHWGEWLVPGEEPNPFSGADTSDVATAYFAHSAGLMARVATVLGRPDDARRYAELHDRVRNAWQREFIADGRLCSDTQANHVRALAFDLVPAGLRTAVAAQIGRAHV